MGLINSDFGKGFGQLGIERWAAIKLPWIFARLQVQQNGLSLEHDAPLLLFLEFLEKEQILYSGSALLLLNTPAKLQSNLM